MNVDMTDRAGTRVRRNMYGCVNRIRNIDNTTFKLTGSLHDRILMCDSWTLLTQTLIARELSYLITLTTNTTTTTSTNANTECA